MSERAVCNPAPDRDSPDPWRAPGHLIHIGYPKSASNALRRWFADHPQLDFVDGGLAGLRDVYQIARDGADPRPGIRLRVTSSEGLAIPHPDFGRPGADYSRLDESDAERDQASACTILRSLFPGAWILIVTRGFADAIRSGFAQFIRAGGDPAQFGPAEAPRRIDAARHPRNYDRLIGLYRSAFGNRVIVLPYELFRDEADTFVGEIERRLGLDHVPAPSVRLNPSPTPSDLGGYVRLSRLFQALPAGGRLRRRLGPPALNADRDWVHRLVRLLQRLSPAPSLPDLLHEDMIEPFRGCAQSLLREPFYGRYAADYLLEPDDAR